MTKATKRRSLAIRMREALEKHKKQPLPDRIQVLVRANLMTQGEADQAIKRIKAQA
jgi:hypothetical protein